MCTICLIKDTSRISVIVFNLNGSICTYIYIGALFLHIQLDTVSTLETVFWHKAAYWNIHNLIILITTAIIIYIPRKFKVCLASLALTWGKCSTIPCTVYNIHVFQCMVSWNVNCTYLNIVLI